MPQYATELRETYNGSRWIGPTITASSYEVAVAQMADSPYKVVGELVEFEMKEDGDFRITALPPAVGGMN